MTADPLGEIWARLQCHDFLIEVIFANMMASKEPREAAVIALEIRRSAKQPRLAEGEDPAAFGDRNMELLREAATMTGDLLQRALDRSDEIRAELKRAERGEPEGAA